MRHTITRWIIDDLRRDLARIDYNKLIAAPYIWLVLMAYLSVEFNAYAELTGQTWRIGAEDSCAIRTSDECVATLAIMEHRNDPELQPFGS